MGVSEALFIPSRQFGPTLLVHPMGKPGKIPEVISVVSYFTGCVWVDGGGKPIIS